MKVYLLRFIPVGTGNTIFKLCDFDGLTVHPRGYGEHSKPHMSSIFFGGSSPWVRGTQDNGVEHNGGKRFIPVGTGNTSA